ncbi:MAG: pyrroloquinoline quinone biosynthesis peptide chaperone PqqD [Akkermansiaceae bacterium]|nr:pyrroloquinoline quinone biosynthesis peptide chaperone PqqD [Verrucomicrobiales bacterium]
MTAFPDTAKPRLASKARLKWDSVRNKPLLLFPEGLLVLNPTANEVLTLCDGQRTLGELVENLKQRFDNPAIDTDVRALLSRLADKGLVTISD